MQALPPLRLTGTIQTYAWGGYELIANLTERQKNKTQKPWAELWLGAHPKGPGMTEAGPLNDFIAADPKAVLGHENANRFEGKLPFLLKVLDVREMLSIQVHPSKQAAEAGFAREEANGPEVTAPNRNYRDRNHKPELGVALTDFYLLHGFKSAAAIRETLGQIPAWNRLIPLLDKGGVKALYQWVMETSQEQINELTEGLFARLKNSDIQDKSQTDFWAKRAFEQYTKDGNHDRGIFSIYWFNLVHLHPGEGIFQAAGIPHAYLEGACVELMANSDNVLRGGLTVKHIDVAELLKHLDFSAVAPAILRLQSSQANTATAWQHYSTAVPDFKLSRIDLSPDQKLTETAGPAIYLVMEGAISIDDAGNSEVKKGNSVFLPHGTVARLEAEKKSVIFRATVG